MGEYFEAEDFRDVTNFNTQETLNALGFATSDIAEMGLSEISKTIRALSRNNRIIEADRQSGYNRDENTTERSGKNERDHIHDGRGLQPSGSDLARTAGAGGGQMVTDEENISQRTAQSPVLQSPDERNPDKTFVGSTAAREGLTEQMKADDMMNWVRLMNNIRNSAQEIVKAQVIYV